MLEPASVILKFGFLAVLYLFLLWVTRSAMRDLRDRPGGTQGEEGTAVHSASMALGHARGAAGEPRLEVASAIGLDRGIAFDLADGAVIGRSDRSNIRIEDGFASTEHARISWQGSLLVLEDLNSTNGTYLNGELLTGPAPLHSGDKVKIGDSEFVYRD